MMYLMPSYQLFINYLILNNMEKKNYRFYVEGQIVPSECGEKVLKRKPLRNVRKYFSAAYISEFLTLINGIKCREKNYNHLANQNALLEVDIDNPCEQVPHWRKEAGQRPVLETENARLRSLFLTKEEQNIVLRSRCKLLTGTLLWMAQKVKQTWLDVFGSEPDVFSEKLKLQMQE